MLQGPQKREGQGSSPRLKPAQSDPNATPYSDLSLLTARPRLLSLPGRGQAASQSQTPRAAPLASEIQASV